MPSTTPVRFRSRHRNYRFGDLRFENFIATTSDQRVIDAARHNPHFGQGRAFWEETAKGEPESQGPEVGWRIDDAEWLASNTSYSDLKRFVAEHNIEVAGQKKDELIAGIVAAAPKLKAAAENN